MAPLAGAGAVNPAVQLLLLPPIRTTGLQIRNEIAAWGLVFGARARAKLRELWFRVAVNNAEALALTADGADAVNVAVVPLVATVTAPGTLTAELPLDSDTTVAAETGALRVTAQEALPGGVILAGLHVTAEMAGTAAGCRYSVRFWETPPRLAVTTAGVVTVTGPFVEALKFATLDPLATVTDAGTLIPVPADSATLVEPVAAALKLTVQDADAGAVRFTGEHVRPEMTGAAVALRVRLKFLEMPLRLAVTVGDAGTLIAEDACAEKVALLDPLLMVTDAGTLTPEPAESATLVALVAAALKLTVQDEAPGGVKLAGLQIRFASAGGLPAEVSVRLKILDAPLSVDVTAASVVVLTAAGTLAEKVALLDPLLIVTDAGTLTPVPPVSAMAVELVAAALRLTVQEETPGGVKLAGAHVRPEIAGGVAAAFSVRLKLAEIPPRVAVTGAVVAALTAEETPAVKLALLAPLLMVTDAGTVTPEPVSATLVALATGAVIATVQEADPGGVKLAGVQVTPERLGPEGWLIVMAAPIPLRPRLLPFVSEAERPEKEIDDDVLVLAGEI